MHAHSVVPTFIPSVTIITPGIHYMCVSLTGNESVILEEPSESFIRGDSKRKSVSWGDTHDMSVCRQLISK